MAKKKQEAKLKEPVRIRFKKLANKVKAEASRREYLTIEELKLLIATECKSEIMKQAFLFSCLCGLRVSDIRKLKWSDLQKSGERIRIEINMMKIQQDGRIDEWCDDNM